MTYFARPLGGGACIAPLCSPAAAGARPWGRPGRRATPAAAGRGQRVGWRPGCTTRLALVPPLPAAGLGNQPMLPPGARGAQGARTGALPGATGSGPTGAGTGGLPGGSKRALGMAGAGPTGVHSAAGAGEALTARPEAEATAASPADALAQPRRGARVPTCARASPPRPAATDAPPPPPLLTAAPGLQVVFGSISAALLIQGGRRPRSHCDPVPPPLPPHKAGKAGRGGCRGTGNGRQGTAPGCTNSTVRSAQRTAP